MGTAHHPRKTILGRADLVAALPGDQPELLASVARQLGLRYESRDVLPEPAFVSELVPRAVSGSTPDSSGYPSNVENIALWLVTGFSSTVSPAPPNEGDLASYVEWKSRSEERPQHRPLAPWSVLHSRLRRGLAKQQSGRRIDVPRLVNQIARRDLIQQMPRLRQRSWNGRLAIIQDFSERLIPFEQDQRDVICQLQKLFPDNLLDVLVGHHPRRLRKRHRNSAAAIGAAGSEHFDVPPAGSQVLVLGDLGVLSGSRRAVQEWTIWGRRMRQSGCRLLALVPCSLERVPSSLQDVWSIHSWQQNATAFVKEQNERAELVREILTLAAPAVRLEPGLLRDLRWLLPGAADASLEVDVWMSSLLASNHPVAASLQPEVANDQLRPRFESLPDVSLQKRALNHIRAWHSRLDAPEVWFEELLCLSERLRKLVPSEDLTDARAAVRAIVQETIDGDSDERESSNAWLSRATSRITLSARNDEQVGALLSEARQKLHPQTAQSESFGFTLGDTSATFFPAGQKSVTQSATGFIRSTDGNIEIATDDIHSVDGFWKYGRPDFAEDFGTDEYGAWFDLKIPSDSEAVVHRLRWIPGGEFLMGSPADEAERSGDEELHRVTLSRGFWLGSTTCTQALWRAVMGSDPSGFKGDDPPVENVSYEDVEAFLARVNELVPGLGLVLPSEAQWEYACRAGTSTPFNTGSNLTTDEANYDGKYPYNNGAKGIHRGETVDCGTLVPNGWGLHEMHGNVWEWCSDWYGSYSGSAERDPTGPESGSARVLRGGSWISNARHARSASRAASAPGDRDHTLGFRCLSSATGAEPAEGVEGPVAEQGPERTRVGGAEKYFRVATLKSTSPENELPRTVSLSNRRRRVIRSDLEEIQLERTPRPAWAVDFGRDLFGAFADFDVPAAQEPHDIRQRLRWIPPGRFLMGSPEDEPGRYGNELPHTVTISAGFWMFDTPCTQDLWQAVMRDDNPSRFPDARRPVEQVTWTQAGDFTARLSELFPDLRLQLPTEAQWEYACRAGTDSAIYTGPLEILGDVNAPALDPIAWYGGNCGHEFDHPKPHSLSQRDRQYDFESGGTRRVKDKAPNPWGLYDMLGNVWEWCQDWHGDYVSDDDVDPTGPESGSLRVLRGGGWISYARNVRSAYRAAYGPGYRDDNLGFRCLSSTSQAAEQVSAPPSPPRDEADTGRRTP